MEEFEKHNEKKPTCIAVANRIINRTNSHNMWRAEQGLPRVSLNGRRLQKILYLCQLFWYADHDESKMITEDFVAWPNGPVIPQIYNYFLVWQEGDMCPIRDAGIYLLTPHSPDGPWAPVYKNYHGAYDIIPKESIKQYIRDKQHREELIDFVKTKKLKRHK